MSSPRHDLLKQKSPSPSSLWLPAPLPPQWTSPRQFCRLRNIAILTDAALHGYGGGRASGASPRWLRLSQPLGQVVNKGGKERVLQFDDTAWRAVQVYLNACNDRAKVGVLYSSRSYPARTGPRVTRSCPSRPTLCARSSTIARSWPASSSRVPLTACARASPRGRWRLARTWLLFRTSWAVLPLLQPGLCHMLDFTNISERSLVIEGDELGRGKVLKKKQEVVSRVHLHKGKGRSNLILWRPPSIPSSSPG